jgi:transcriptional regulator GlxA family with amidase domain
MKKIGRIEFISMSIALVAGANYWALAFPEKGKKKSQSMKRNVGILIFDDAEVLDFAGPFEVFSVTSQLNNFEPFQVFTLSQEKKPVTAVNGLKVLPDFSIDRHPPIDVLIISGGQGTRALLDDTKLLQWIERTYNASQVTLCICSGARLLGKLGLLNDKPFCTHHEVYENMKTIAPKGIPQKYKRFVQTDERLYTSGGISAGIDLSFSIVEKLLGKETAIATAKYMEYNVQSL